MIGRLTTRWNRFAGERALRRAIAQETRRAGTDPPRSIFVLRNNDLGDLLVATPLFGALRALFPGARIVVGAGPWAAPLLAGDPAVDEVLDMPAPWFNKYTRNTVRAARRFAMASPQVDRLRSERVDVGIDPLGSSWGALLMVRGGVARRLGTRGYAGGEVGFDAGVAFDPRESVVRRCLRFAEILGAGANGDARPRVALAPSELERADRRWSELGAPEASRRLVVSPGAGASSKAWPVDRFAALVAALVRAPGESLAIVGGPAERALCDRVGGGRVANLAGGLDLRETCAFVGRADLVVCNSSFVLHAAAATGTPAIALLGPAFHSASSHQRQWGYEGLTRSLGPERSAGVGLTSVAEALAAIEAFGGDRRRRDPLEGD